MHKNLIDAVGLLAEFVLIMSQIPQIYRAFKLKETRDLSLLTIFAVIIGLSLWVVYGLVKPDFVIVIANVASLLTFCVVLYAKIKFS
ncbi:MAG TPA: SemiSWEET family transporter [Candidatus Saccharimonadales bacterium]|nr:SemiSWEET family transporter [Candidatus Saccharimonadales bacterium]